MRKIILLSLFFSFMFSCEQTSVKEQKTTVWCGQAFEDLEKLMTALKETVPKGEAASIQIPRRSFYLKQCHRLPLKAQQCLAVSFARENTKSCQSLNLKGEDKTNFEALVSGK